MLKKICLGTAMWGWTVNRSVVFDMLDAFYTSGGRWIDTAANYPLNGDLNLFRYASKLLQEWLMANNIQDMNIIYKAGSLTNKLSPECNLTPFYLDNEHQMISEMYTNNNICLMLHWDNRDSQKAIDCTWGYLSNISKSKNRIIGVSGILHPELYTSLFQGFPNIIHVETKHNFVQDGLKRYSEWHAMPNVKFWAYGICVGGLKLTEFEYTNRSYAVVQNKQKYHTEAIKNKIKQQIRQIISSTPCMANVYDFAMSYAEKANLLTGYIVAPSTLDQMQNILSYRRNLEEPGNIDILSKIDFSFLNNLTC